MKMRNKLILFAGMAMACACMPIPSIDDENTGAGGGKNPSLYPMAVYHFDGDASDASGSGYDGVLNGSPEFISDTPDGSTGALKLNAFKNQFVNIPYDLFKGLDQYSFSAWVKDFSQGIIFSAEGGNGLPYLYVQDTQKFLLYNHRYTDYSLSSYTFAYDCTSIMSSAWHHLAVVSYGGDMSLYIDGQKRDTMKEQYDLSTATKVYIGGNADGRYVNYMSMKIDNVMFFDYSLKDDEVKYIYQNKL